MEGSNVMVPASDPDASAQLSAEIMLREARDGSAFLGKLDAGDLASLAQSISIVGYEAGEQVLVKGEPATWVGIVLSGELAASVDGAVVGTMGIGKIVGELAFFTGGNRLADVNGSKSGHIAFIMLPHLHQLFCDAPTTATKLVHAFGVSSLYQLSHNPVKHAALGWDMQLEEAASCAQAWQEAHFDDSDADLDAADVRVLAAHTRCHRFAEGEPLIDRFADNDGVITFVVSGCVLAVIKGVIVRTYEEGELISLNYFDASLLPFDTVGGSGGGVLGGITREAYARMAEARPLLALSFLRRIGKAAVSDVLGGTLSRKHGGSIGSVVPKPQLEAADAKASKDAARPPAAAASADPLANAEDLLGGDSSASPKSSHKSPRPSKRNSAAATLGKAMAGASTRRTSLGTAPLPDAEVLGAPLEAFHANKLKQVSLEPASKPTRRRCSLCSIPLPSTVLHFTPIRRL